MPYCLCEQEKDNEKLAKYGGQAGVAKMLATDLHHGLSDAEVEKHRQAYGPNTFPEKPPPSFFMMMFEAAKDPMIIILLIVALVGVGHATGGSGPAGVPCATCRVRCSPSHRRVK